MSDQPRMPSHLVLAALLAVDLLDHDQRDHHLVVLEGEDRVGIVEEDVGVEDVDLLHMASDCVLGWAYSPWFSNGSSSAIFVIKKSALC